jgi:hypothetical protein
MTIESNNIGPSRRTVGVSLSRTQPRMESDSEPVRRRSHLRASDSAQRLRTLKSERRTPRTLPHRRRSPSSAIENERRATAYQRLRPHPVRAVLTSCVQPRVASRSCPCLMIGSLEPGRHGPPLRPSHQRRSVADWPRAARRAKCQPADLLLHCQAARAGQLALLSRARR